MSRDWQKDMETWKAASEGPDMCVGDYEVWCEYVDENGNDVLIADFEKTEDALFYCEAYEALPYWLQQYAEVKEERDELESLAENLNADVGKLEKELAAEKGRTYQAEAKAGFWEMEYYALQREYNEYRTIYPPAVLEEGETT